MEYNSISRQVGNRKVWASPTPMGKFEVKEAGIFGKVYGTYTSMEEALDWLEAYVEDETIPYYKPR